jgi:hypothetical protein
VVALLFVFAFGMLQITIENTEAEIDRLYATTIVNAEVRQSPGSFGATNRIIDDIIPKTVVDSIMGLGFIADTYLESGHTDAFLSDEPIQLFATDDLRHFTEDMRGFLGRRVVDIFAGGANMHIEFTDGADFDSFVYEDESLHTPVPVVVPDVIMLSRGLSLGDEVIITYINPVYPEYELTVSAWIMGVHDNGNLPPVMSDSVMIPISALEFMLGQSTGYMAFRFSINPAYNRALDDITQDMERTILLSMASLPRFEGRPLWTDPVTLFVMDQELRLVVQATEGNLSLLQLLFPVTVVLTGIIGAGLAVLIMLQNSKNAAIMRALGQTKIKAGLILWIEQMLVCVAGAVLGVLILIFVRSGFEIQVIIATAPYLAGSAIGTLIGAVLIIYRPPLELLQVKE